MRQGDVVVQELEKIVRLLFLISNDVTGDFTRTKHVSFPYLVPNVFVGTYTAGSRKVPSRQLLGEFGQWGALM